MTFVALSHQNSLILVFGMFQFCLTSQDLVAQGCLTQSDYHLTFLNLLTHLHIEGYNLFVESAVYGHLRHSLNSALTRKSFCLDCLLQALRGCRLGIDRYRLRIRVDSFCRTVCLLIFVPVTGR